MPATAGTSTAAGRNVNSSRQECQQQGMSTRAETGEARISRDASQKAGTKAKAGAAATATPGTSAKARMPAAGGTQATLGTPITEGTPRQQHQGPQDQQGRLQLFVCVCPLLIKRKRRRLRPPDW